MKYHQIVWTLEEIADRWPATSVYVACWPLFLAVLQLLGGHV